MSASAFVGANTLYVGSKIEGASGVIVTRDSPLCLTQNWDGNDSSSWVMLENGIGYAQSGQLFSAIDTCHHYFGEYWDGSTPFYNYTTPVCATIGAAHTYHTNWSSVCACLTSYVDAAQYVATPWNPMVVWGAPSPTHPWNVDVYDEVHYPTGSDASGTAALKMDAHALQYQNFANNNLYSLCTASTGVAANGLSGALQSWPNPPGGAARYTADVPGCDHVRAWTVTP